MLGSHFDSSRTLPGAAVNRKLNETKKRKLAASDIVVLNVGGRYSPPLLVHTLQVLLRELGLAPILWAVPGHS